MKITAGLLGLNNEKYLSIPVELNEDVLKEISGRKPFIYETDGIQVFRVKDENGEFVVNKKMMFIIFERIN